MNGVTVKFGIKYQNAVYDKIIWVKKKNLNQKRKQ